MAIPFRNTFRITPSMLQLLLFSLLLSAVSASPRIITDPTKFPPLENSPPCISDEFSINSTGYLPRLLNCAKDDWSCVCNATDYAATFTTLAEQFCLKPFPSNYTAVAGNATTDLIEFCDQLLNLTTVAGTTNNTSSCTNPSQPGLTVSHNLYL